MCNQSVRVLFVVDQLPYPPRNGITLPTYNYGLILQRRYDLRLLFLSATQNLSEIEYWEENNAIFKEISVIHLKRYGFFERVKRELQARDTIALGWGVGRKESVGDIPRADVLIVSPFSAAAKLTSLGILQRDKYKLRIAAVNDCTTAEYYFRCAQKNRTKLDMLKCRLDRARSYLIRRVENNILSQFDNILMQTQRDSDLMLSLVSPKFASKVCVVPNGISPNLQELKRSSDGCTVILVADLGGEYDTVVTWLVSEVWPKVVASHSRAKLHIIGKNASSKLLSCINGAQNVIYTEYIRDLGQVYATAAMALSPVFKGYGLINKTIEAMAAGVPVIGGEAAFNGIDNFLPEVHGIVCLPWDKDGLAHKIVNMLNEPKYASNIGMNGKRLVCGKFSWDLAENTLSTIINLACTPLRQHK